MSMNICPKCGERIQITVRVCPLCEKSAIETTAEKAEAK